MSSRGVRTLRPAIFPYEAMATAVFPSTLSGKRLNAQTTLFDWRKPMKRQSLLTSAWTFLFGIILVGGLTAAPAFGQAGTSTIRGLVKDPQGNVVSGATVSITNSA